MILINKSRLKDIFDRFNGKKVMIIGDVMVDEYLTGRVSRISPEAPVPVVDISEETIKFGGAGNVAYNLLHLGCQPLLIGTIGQDLMGEHFIEMMHKNKMVSDGMIKLIDRPTSVKTRIIGHAQHIVRFDRESTKYLNGKDEINIIKMVDKFINDADAIIVEDYNKGMLTLNVINSIIQAAQKNNKLISVDPKFINFFNYKNVSVFKPNIREIEYAFAVQIKKQDDLIIFGRKLLDQLNAKCVLITCGAEGMSLFEANKEPVHVKTQARNIADVSGAGDTVISTLTAALIGGASYQEAATIANYAAGIVCEEVGIVPVNIDKLFQVYLGKNS